MAKEVSRGLALEILSRVPTQTNWGELDGEKLHVEVATLSPEEFGRRMTAFLKNGMRFILGGLKVVCAPFSPPAFIGKGWAFWKGPKDGDGMEGEEERDKPSLALTEVDFDKADFLTCLEGEESSITGEEKFLRLRKLGRSLYGTTQFMGLWENYQSCEKKTDSVLEKLYQQRGITYIDFFGDILRSPLGHRCVLSLFRDAVGVWLWSFLWLGDGWLDRDFSAISQQVSK